MHAPEDPARPITACLTARSTALEPSGVPGAGVPGAPQGTEAVWRELLDEEVMPWLHRALADIAAKSAAV